MSAARCNRTSFGTAPAAAADIAAAVVVVLGAGSITGHVLVAAPLLSNTWWVFL